MVLALRQVAPVSNQQDFCELPGEEEFLHESLAVELTIMLHGM